MSIRTNVKRGVAAVVAVLAASCGMQTAQAATYEVPPVHYAKLQAFANPAILDEDSRERLAQTALIVTNTKNGGSYKRTCQDLMIEVMVEANVPGAVLFNGLRANPQSVASYNPTMQKEGTKETVTFSGLVEQCQVNLPKMIEGVQNDTKKANEEFKARQKAEMEKREATQARLRAKDEADRNAADEDLKQRAMNGQISKQELYELQREATLSHEGERRLAIVRENMNRKAPASAPVPAQQGPQFQQTPADDSDNLRSGDVAKAVGAAIGIGLAIFGK